jgi:hypothetical protein
VQFFESSKDVLRIGSFPQLVTGRTATFDRVKKTAVIVSFAMLFPVQRTVVPLEDIQSALVRKRERQNGRVVYGLTLRRRRGDDIPLPCRTRDDAMKYMRAISDFLALH